MTTVDDDAILSATRAVLSERAGDGGLTAKDVRHAVEERLALQRDALLERREVVIAASAVVWCPSEVTLVICGTPAARRCDGA